MQPTETDRGDPHPTEPLELLEPLEPVVRRSAVESSAEAIKGLHAFARMARDLFDVPLATVGLLSDDKWHTTSAGCANGQPSSWIAFCAATVASPGVLVVRDTRVDPRFATDPATTGERAIHFCLGQPIATRNGERVGAICVMSGQPREVTTYEVLLLRDLADCVEATLDTGRHPLSPRR